MVNTTDFRHLAKTRGKITQKKVQHRAHYAFDVFEKFTTRARICVRACEVKLAKCKIYPTKCTLHRKKIAIVKKKLYLCIGFKKNLTQVTVYEHITRLMQAGFWRAELGLYHRANTLDFQYRLYTIMQQLEPEHTYGYLFRLLDNKQIYDTLVGGGTART